MPKKWQIDDMLMVMFRLKFWVFCSKSKKKKFLQILVFKKGKKTQTTDQHIQRSAYLFENIKIKKGWGSIQH